MAQPSIISGSNYHQAWCNRKQIIVSIAKIKNLISHPNNDNKYTSEGLSIASCWWSSNATLKYMTQYQSMTGDFRDSDEATSVSIALGVFCIKLSSALWRMSYVSSGPGYLYSTVSQAQKGGYGFQRFNSIFLGTTKAKVLALSFLVFEISVSVVITLPGRLRHLAVHYSFREWMKTELAQSTK